MACRSRPATCAPRSRPDRPVARGAQARRHRAGPPDHKQRRPAVWALRARRHGSPARAARRDPGDDAAPRPAALAIDGRSATSAAATSRRRSSAAGSAAAPNPALRRADARHRRRRQGRDLQPDRGAGRGRSRDHRGLVGAAGDPPARRPGAGDARRAHLGQPGARSAERRSNRRACDPAVADPQASTTEPGPQAAQTS